MTLITEFAEFVTGVPHEWLVYSGGADGVVTGEVPLYFSFRSPFMRNGDQLDLRAAMLAIPNLTALLSGGATSSITQEVELRQVEIDYEILHTAESIRGISVYPGKPPRVNLGSIAEKLGDRVIHYSYLTYNPQYIGRRTVLLEPTSPYGGWGSHIVPRSSPELDQNIQLFRREKERACPIDKVQIHVPRAIWDVNEDTDPPLPPSYEPLDFVIQGNGVVSYSYLYGVTDSSTGEYRPAQILKLSDSWAFVSLPGSDPDLLEPLEGAPSSVWL